MTSNQDAAELTSNNRKSRQEREFWDRRPRVEIAKLPPFRAKARVTIVGYLSLTCPYCADFEENVLPLLRMKYIETGKVRFVLREFPLDPKALAATIVVRCIAAGDSKKYFDALAQSFILQPALLAQPLETLQIIGHRFELMVHHWPYLVSWELQDYLA